MSLRVGIIGASGYGGGELLRLLHAHPRVDEIQAMSRRNAGKPVWSIHPNLREVVEQPFIDKVDWQWLAESATPVLFSAIPHGELAKRYVGFREEWDAAGLGNKLTVIDLSADFRIVDSTRYERHYGGQHPCPELLSEWTYGLPETNAQALVGAKRISSPGCFATALQLGLLPILELQDVLFAAAFGVTGSSGSGMEPSETTHHPTRSNDFRAYKLLRHQHMAEVEQMLGQRQSSLAVSFMSHSAPIVRGILVTIQFESSYGHELEEHLESTFSTTRFVRIVGPNSPRVASVVGSNFADIGWAVNGASCAVMVAVDNLLKGMAGQAVQNMNLALGFDEAEGLGMAGGFPY